MSSTEDLPFDKEAIVESLEKRTEQAKDDIFGLGVDDSGYSEIETGVSEEILSETKGDKEPSEIFKGELQKRNEWFMN